MENYSSKKWGTAILLSLFLGGFGIHSFYVGRTRRGIAQLFTLGGLGIWSIVDFLTLLFGNFKDSEGLPLKKPKNALTIAGGVLGGFVILIIIIAISSGKNESGNEKSKTEKAAASEESPKVLPKPGETVKTEKFDITLTGIQPTNWVGNQFMSEKPAEGAIFIIVSMKYKNISNKSIGSFSQPSFKLVDPSGNRYDSASAASIAYSTVSNQTKKALSDLNPGISVTEADVFEVSSELWQKSGWKLNVDADDDITFQIK